VKLARFLSEWLALLMVIALTQALAGQARVIEISGAVTFMQPQRPMASLKLNDQVRYGDEILTDFSSTAVLRLTDGSRVHIQPGTRVVFENPSASLWKNFLNVVFGAVKLYIEKVSGRPNPKSVTTPTAIIAVRGTIFNVKVDQDETTQVDVEEGLVSVTDRSESPQEVLLEPGFQTFVRRGQIPFPPSPRGTPPPAAAARMERPNSPANLPGRGGPASASTTSRPGAAQPTPGRMPTSGGAGPRVSLPTTGAGMPRVGTPGTTQPQGRTGSTTAPASKPAPRRSGN
jgi:hypothetical protein